MKLSVLFSDSGSKKLPDGTVRVLVEGKQRATLSSLAGSGDCLTATVTPVTDESASGTEVIALMRSVVDQFENYAKLNKKLPAHPVVKDIAARHGASPHAVVLAWVLEQASNVIVIPGARTVEHALAA